MNRDQVSGPASVVRAIPFTRIAKALLGLLFLAFWALLYGSAVRTHLVAGNTYMAAYAGAWLVSPVVVVGWISAKEIGRGKRLFRWLSVGTYSALFVAYWVYLWGHSLIDQVGSLPMTLLQATLLLAPLLVAAAFYLTMGSSTLNISPRSSSG